MVPHAFQLHRTAIFSAAVALLLAASSTAAAQTPPALSGAAPQSGLVWSVEFAQRVTGRHLIITTTDGRQFEGVVNVSQTGLETTGTALAASVPFNQIVRVEKPTYRIRKGVWIGVAAGASIGLVGTCTVGTCDEAAFLSSVAFGALGAGTGAAIGAVLNRRHVNDDILYDSNRRTTSIAPILAPRHKGVAVRVTWR